jgi:hypothetical protein
MNTRMSSLPNTKALHPGVFVGVIIVAQFQAQKLLQQSLTPEIIPQQAIAK